MPDTYLSFVVGYSAFFILLFGLTAFLLKRVLRLEKEVESISQSFKSK